jgi:nitrogen fixation protein NifU and related proteins
MNDKDSGRKPPPEKEEGGAGSGSVDRSTPHLDDLYREVVLDHYRHPRGRRELADPNVSVQGYNPTCGDQVHVALALEGDRIKEVQVECQGCSISVASGSMMAELLQGKTKEEVDHLAESVKGMMHGREPEPGLDLGDMDALEGVRQFPVRIKCALLAWTTLQEALTAFAHRTAAASGAEAPEPPRSGSGEGTDHAHHS